MTGTSGKIWIEKLIIFLGVSTQNQKTSRNHLTSASPVETGSSQCYSRERLIGQKST